MHGVSVLRTKHSFSLTARLTSYFSPDWRRHSITCPHASFPGYRSEILSRNQCSGTSDAPALLGDHAAWKHCLQSPEPLSEQQLANCLWSQTFFFPLKNKLCLPLGRKEVLSSDSCFFFFFRDCMKMGEVDGKKIGCTVSLLVRKLFLFSSLQPNVHFPRNTVFCLFLIHNVLLPGCFLEKFKSVFRRGMVSFRLNQFQEVLRSKHCRVHPPVFPRAPMAGLIRWG